MFDQIFDAIEEWMRELLSGVIHSNLDQMFTDVNEKTGEIAGQVGQYFQYDREPVRFCDPADRRDHHYSGSLLRADFDDHREKQYA